MAHWLNLLIELLLIRIFRVSCPQDDNFFWGQLMNIHCDGAAALTPSPSDSLTSPSVLQQDQLSHKTNIRVLAEWF